MITNPMRISSRCIVARILLTGKTAIGPSQKQRYTTNNVYKSLQRVLPVQAAHLPKNFLRGTLHRRPQRRFDASAAMGDVTYLTQDEAVAIDEQLMGPLGFSIDQLMELAGLSVASAIQAEYPPESFARVLIIAGPGNNGGDGLVAARHLRHFGYSPEVLYPKQTERPLYHALLTQLGALGVPLLEWERVKEGGLADAYDLIVDAIFGFSFKGQPRAPFDQILAALRPDSHSLPVASIDIPSGWDVERGDLSGRGLRPEMLISLTAPKMAAKYFTGMHHYVGGRFIPPILQAQYALQQPPYPGSAQCVKLPTPGAGTEPSQMRAPSKDTPLHEASLQSDPFKQFDIWFKAAVGHVAEPTAMCLATVSASSQPNARFVLLKAYDECGFVFYTNSLSAKGTELRHEQRAAICLYWGELERQVRAQGVVVAVSSEEADAYFRSRPRSSQIGAWVSQQSSVIGSREELDDAAEVLRQSYIDDNIEVPRPPHWGGFRLVPENVEFWQGRASRLHDRILFKRNSEGGGWSRARLAP